MTISILAYDEVSGRFGGAATTGSLCVGGWVLRGDSTSGMSASQGTSPSTLWGAAVLHQMQDGKSAQDAVDEVVTPDTGKDFRQLSALDTSGRTGAFTGAKSVAVCGHVADKGTVVSGNILANSEVLDATLQGYLSASGTFSERLIKALVSAAHAGGDNRGLLSAALLVVGRDIAPLSLRVDYASDPIAALRELHDVSQSQPYSDWANAVPTLNEPFKGI